MATTAGVPTSLLVATCGEGSAPAVRDAHACPAGRPAPTRAGRCGRRTRPRGRSRHRLDVPDGQVGRAPRRHRRSHRGPGRRRRGVMIAAPYRADGHPDHEAMAAGAAAAAHRTGALLAEYPIWMWHAETPTRCRGSGSSGCPTRPGDPRGQAGCGVPPREPGEAPVRPTGRRDHPSHAGPRALHRGRVLRADRCPEEPTTAALDRLHAEQPDPWGAETRWYEERKRSLLLAALPRKRFTRALEVGCSTGVLAQALTERVTPSSRSTALRAVRLRGTDCRRRVDVRVLAAPQELAGGSVRPRGGLGGGLLPQSRGARWPRRQDRRVPGPDGASWPCATGGTRSRVAPRCCQVHSAFARGALPAVAATYRDRDVEIVVHAAAEHWPEPDR